MNSPVEGHPVQGRLPGIETTVGSLGKGISVGLGHVLGGRLNGLSYHMYVLTGDGQVEYVGKECWRPRIQIWKRREVPSPLTRFRHRLLDRDKANTATDILAVAVDGDDLLDAVCGSWWYKNPTWKRFDIPGCSKRFRVGQRVRLLRK